MATSKKEIYGVTLDQWSAAFRPGMPEFAATQFVFSGETPEQVRIAFGNRGPFIDEKGNREPVYTHAVTLPSETAVALAHALLKHYAAPKSDKS